MNSEYDIKRVAVIVHLKNFQVPYARSEGHLMEVVENVCTNFEDYAQAKYKASDKATIIR